MVTLAAVSVLLPLTAGPAAAATFSNTDPVFIPGLTGSLVTPARPYPSNIRVSELSGVVLDVNVKLCDFTATFPSDANVMLVAGGRNATIMSDVGGNGNEPPDPEADTPVRDIDITLDDAAAPMPADSPLTAGTYRPTDDDVGEMDFDFPNEAMPNPAPPPSGKVALSTFSGIDPNGTWSLYMVDDFPADEDDGEKIWPRFKCGWGLEITVGPAPTCFGQPATIIGAETADANLNGTEGPDVIAGRGGNDTIDGFGGTDRICGDDGADTINGGGARDRLNGGAGNDTLNGGPGNDILSGASGNDTLRGEDGDDSLAGGAGTDNCSGGPGTNTIAGCES